MLSRVAERLYWMARYLERAENTARLINCYNNLIMDIPLGSEPSWTLLVDILDAKDDFQKHYAKQNERNVHKFLTGKASVPCSIPFGIEAARENVRTTRDVLPEEAWEQINELHLFATANANAYSSRRTRLLFLALASALRLAFGGRLIGLCLQPAVLRASLACSNAPAETIFDLNLQTKNTGISSYFFNKKKITLSCFNMVPHLDTNELRAHITY